VAVRGIGVGVGDDGGDDGGRIGVGVGDDGGDDGDDGGGGGGGGGRTPGVVVDGTKWVSCNGRCHSVGSEMTEQKACRSGTRSHTAFNGNKTHSLSHDTTHNLFSPKSTSTASSSPDNTTSSFRAAANTSTTLSSLGTATQPASTQTASGLSLGMPASRAASQVKRSAASRHTPSRAYLVSRVFVYKDEGECEHITCRRCSGRSKRATFTITSLFTDGGAAPYTTREAS
jgi:hypothetical protein